MGNQKIKWTSEEEDALVAGIKKHGAGKWKTILLDPQFAPLLTSRSNIDLKESLLSSFFFFLLLFLFNFYLSFFILFFLLQDKWRNMNVYVTAQGVRTPKPKVAATPSSDVVINDPCQNEQDVNTPPRYNAMVFEALSTLKDTNGSDLNAIASFIEQKHQVPQNFRRTLSSRLRTLVNQEKLEKVQNCYKIKKETSLVTKSPSSKQKAVRPQQQPSASDDMLDFAADTAAYIVAEAENKSYLAVEAVKETERISRLAEENDAMLLLAEQLYKQCLRGETVKWA